MTDVKEFVVLDTTVVQARSVLNFMYALGYTLDDEVGSGRFVTKNRALNGNKYLSFNTAAKLHNLEDDGWYVISEYGEVKPVCVELARGFSTLGVQLAKASKLVKQVKLSINKHGIVNTLDVMVVPLNKAVEGLIGL